MAVVVVVRTLFVVVIEGHVLDIEGRRSQVLGLFLAAR